jgi:1-aminocyclopropane-1-carboxylate deaminase
MGEGRTATPALDLRIPSPVEELVDDLLTRRAIHLYLKRDDLIHPELPGNKWRKLKFNLSAAADLGHDTLLTFGGAYSNPSAPPLRPATTSGSLQSGSFAAKSTCR